MPLISRLGAAQAVAIALLLTTGMSPTAWAQSQQPQPAATTATPAPAAQQPEPLSDDELYAEVDRRWADPAVRERLSRVAPPWRPGSVLLMPPPDET